MKIWLDAHLSPRLASWLTDTFGATALAVRDAGLREAGDEEIFFAARSSADIVITKDSDFVKLLLSWSDFPFVPICRSLRACRVFFSTRPQDAVFARAISGWPTSSSKSVR